MFTGIIEKTGVVESFKKGENAWKLKVNAKGLLDGVELGDSIAVNGCCLTVTEFDTERVYFDVLEESRRLTGFSAIKEGGTPLVNLERALRFGGKMGGHFVTGHIDGVGVVEILEQRGNDFYLQVRAPKGSARYLIHKGSIAIDGISLTVAEVEGDVFRVWLIPTTMDVTNLKEKKVGDLVNLEFDLLGKYVEKLMAKRDS